MFRVLTLLGLLITFALLAIVSKKNWEQIKQGICAQKNTSLNTIKNIKHTTFSEILKNLLFPILVLCVVIFAITGFIPAIILGESITGYLLLIHVTIAPVFAVAMAIVSLIWTHKYRFDDKDWQVIGKKKPVKDEQKIIFWQKLSFWFLMILTLPIILSILLSMYPLFGSDIQHTLLDTHRYSALLFVISGLTFSYFSLLVPKRKSTKKV